MLQLQSPNMAKKRAGRPKSAKKPIDRNKPIIATLRGSDDFREYLEEAANADQRTVASFIERAIVLYAKAVGVNREPPKR